jgi:hypothetical protein
LNVATVTGVFGSSGVAQRNQGLLFLVSFGYSAPSGSFISNSGISVPLFPFEKKN